MGDRQIRSEEAHPYRHPNAMISDFGALFLAQLEREAARSRAFLKYLTDHPPIVSPVISICGRPWWIWYDELGDPIRFVWVEDRLQ
jgi:hypothetical protein